MNLSVPPNGIVCIGKEFKPHTIGRIDKILRIESEDENIDTIYIPSLLKAQRNDGTTLYSYLFSFSLTFRRFEILKSINLTGQYTFVSDDPTAKLGRIKSRTTVERFAKIIYNMDLEMSDMLSTIMKGEKEFSDCAFSTRHSLDEAMKYAQKMIDSYPHDQRIL